MSIRTTSPARPSMAVLAALALCASLLGLATTAAPGAAGAPAGAASAPAAARHAAYAVVTGGRTALALDPATAKVLTDNGVSVAPASEAEVVKAGIAFPISGGLLDGKTLAGTVKHTGGLSFVAGGKSLTIRDFTVNTRARVLTAYADEAGVRLPVLSLKLGRAKIAVSRTRLVVARLPVTLGAKAAQTLNTYFSTDLFAGGLKIGTVRLDARIRTLRS